MSVIAVKKYNNRIEISADSIQLRGNLVDKFKKLIKNNIANFYVGVTGDANYCNFLMENVKVCVPKSNSFSGMSTYIKTIVDKMKTFFEVDAHDIFDNLSGIFVYNDKIWALEYGEIKEIDDYYSIGIACVEVSTLLFVGKSPRESIEIACQINNCICLPTTNYVIEK